MPWWVWLLFGLLLLILEVVTPTGFFLFFFGIGAFLVGAAVAVGLFASAALQWLLFTTFSIVAVALLRRPMKERLDRRVPAGAVENVIGERAVALEELAVGSAGRAELRGTTWSARNVGPIAVARGQACRVERLDGLTLCVRAD
jgi:inner membrane protein